MLIFELVARFRKELLLTGSAFSETIMAIAERVNRKVQVLRLHAQATHHLRAIRQVHCQVGRQVADHVGGFPESTASSAPEQRLSAMDMDGVVAAAALELRQTRDQLMKVEARIRELKSEVIHEGLLALQRDFQLRDAALERVVVARGAPILGHPLGDVPLPSATRIVSAFRGPFLLPLSDQLVLRPDDVVLLFGLRADLDLLLPQFQKQYSSKTAS
jgi:hypothetical protein